MNAGEWYWVSKPIIQEYTPKVGYLAICVYHFLASFTDKSQSCFPSQIFIAEKLGCSRSSVNKAVKKLEKVELIKILKRKKYHCVYNLLEVRCIAEDTKMSSQGN